jgi:ABC-2 type transport system ATP-binding protein
MAHAIETHQLARSFGAVRAVDGLDLAVPTGSVYGFVGPNGSGKTTTIRMLLGLIRPDRGSVRLFDEPLSRRAALFARLGALVERPAFYPGLSARDNLRAFGVTAGLSGSAARTRAAAVLERVDLLEAADRPVRGFSTGMRQRLAIGLALLREPDLVILDEPTAGLDPAGVVAVRALIAELGRSGATVFLSSHVLSEVEHLCDRIAVLHHGRCVAEGRTADLLAGASGLSVRFETVAEADSARAVLTAGGWQIGPRHADDPCLITLASAGEDGRRVSQALAVADLFPAQLTAGHASLEAVFLELTDDDAKAGLQ